MSTSLLELYNSQARIVVFVSAALPHCAALRPGRVKGPPRAPSGAAGPLGCARGTVSTAAPRGEILGFGGSGVLPGGPNLGCQSCAARLRGPGAASNLKRHARFSFFVWRRLWKVGADGHHLAIFCIELHSSIPFPHVS